jgi:hypothetical protein
VPADQSEFSFTVGTRLADSCAPSAAQVSANGGEFLGRTGTITTPHGEINTPAFIAVGTKATVKSVLPESMADLGAQALLAGRHGVVRTRGVHGLHIDDLLEPRAQAHHLEPAGVREGGTLPVHEGAQPAGLVQDVRTRLEVEVVGVGQQRLRPELRHGLRQD